MPTTPKPKTNPLAYLITFTCYGARLHAGEKTSVDRNHNVFATPYLQQIPTQPIRRKTHA